MSAHPRRAKEGISSYLIPIFLGKVQTRGSPLNTSAINENVYLAAHYVESVLEEVLDCVEIMEVAVNDLCSTTKGTDDIQGL